MNRTQEFNNSLTTEKRNLIFDTILNAGISHENNKQWKDVIMKMHSESKGKTKKILKALATAKQTEIERILKGMGL